jgi:hypothetical protein
LNLLLELKQHSDPTLYVRPAGEEAEAGEEDYEEVGDKSEL